MTANQIARVLKARHGVRAADRVAVLGDGETMWPVYHALWQLGACAVPLDIGTLNNTQTLVASHAVCVVAQPQKVARAAQAVQLGAPECKAVIDLAELAWPRMADLAPPSAAVAAATEALLLYLYFMDKVRAFSYAHNDLCEYVRRCATEARPKFRPKLAALVFYPIVDELVKMLIGDGEQAYN